jgi:hypothetical protein
VSAGIGKMLQKNEQLRTFIALIGIMYQSGNNGLQVFGNFAII